MNDQDDKFDDIDERPMVAVPYYDVVQELDRRKHSVIQGLGGKPIPLDIAEQFELALYTSSVLMHGNASGRCNETITLPQPWRLADIIAIIGKPEDFTPGSDASWRAIRRLFDSTHCGRQGNTGHTRR